MGTPATDVIRRVDESTGLNINYKETTLSHDGTAMSDGKCNALYRKKGSKYYKVEDRINLRFFGAKGDGSTNDQAAIVTALAVLKANRKKMLSPFIKTTAKLDTRTVLYIPDGHYIVSGNIYLPRYVAIQGESREGTVIQCTNQNNHVFRLEPDITDGFDPWIYSFTRLSNFTVAGKHFATNPSEYHMDMETRGLGCGIYMKDRIKVELTNVRCSGFEDAGIRTDNCYYIPMTRVQCDTNLAGLAAYNSTTTIHCSKSDFSHNSIGVVINESFSNYFESTTFESNTANFLPVPLAGSENETMVKTGQGIVIRTSFNNCFKACYVEENIINVTLDAGAYGNTFEDCIFCPSSFYNAPTYITSVFLSFYGSGNKGNRFIHNYHVDSIANTHQGRNIEIRAVDYGSDTEICTISKTDYDRFKAQNASWSDRVAGYEYNAPTIHNPSTGHKFIALIERGNPYLRTVGTTAQRPTGGSYGGLPVGTPYYDTTLNKPIWWSSSEWRDAAGTVV